MEDREEGERTGGIPFLSFPSLSARSSLEEDQSNGTKQYKRFQRRGLVGPSQIRGLGNCSKHIFYLLL